MSSHHIVRDQQEPALLIRQLDHFPLHILHQLLEWLPTVVCCEESVSLYSTLSHKLDVALVCSQNQEYWEEELRAQAPVSVIGVKEEVFLQKGLEILAERKHKAVNIIASDLSLSGTIHQSLKWSELVEIVIYTESGRHVLHQRLLYKKWLPACSRLSVATLSDRTCFSTEGFDIDLKEEWFHGEIELLKTGEGAVVIKSSKVPFLISEGL